LSGAARDPRRAWRWALFGLLLAGFVLLPFALFEDQLDALVRYALQDEQTWLIVLLAVIGFLLLDIVLPIPSSFVLAAAGYLLGPAWGSLACFVGLSGAALVGYGLGHVAGEPLARRLVGADGLHRFEGLWRRHADLVLLCFRAMPVLAETSVVLAGVARMCLWRFVALVSVGNAVVAAMYALLGAWSAQQASFLLLSAAAMLLPGLTWLLARRLSAA
jgi:uncharacterized membrane protein YdjX (TVP38/TMEM64 family)